MNEPNETFRERLLDMDTLNSSQAGTSRERIRAMLDTRLTLVVRIGLGLLALFGLWSAISFGSLAFGGRWHAEDIIYRPFLTLAFVSAIAWMGLTGWTAVAGVLRRTQRPWIVVTTLAVGFFYVVHLMFVFVTPISHEESQAEFGTQWGLMWFFLLNTIGLCTILSVLYRGQFKSQEKLLEIEYRLADLAEKLGDKRQS